MHEPPAAGAGTESGLACSIAASAALARGIRPPPLPSSSSAAQTALTSRGQGEGRSPRGREGAYPTPGSAAALLFGQPPLVWRDAAAGSGALLLEAGRGAAQ